VSSATGLRARIDPYYPRPNPTAEDGPDAYGNPDPEWLRIDWRAHLATVEVDGTVVNYVEMKPPPSEQAPRAIVFVHGLSGCWQNWLEQIPHFARDYRVIALDLPGFGCSPLPDWEITISAYGELLRRFCDELDVRDATLVGNSMGGFVSAEAVVTEKAASTAAGLGYASQPDRFERLALVSAAGVSSIRLKREPTAVAARMLAAAAPYAFNLQTRSFRRPRARAIAFKNIFRHPQRLRAELLWEFFEGGTRADAFADALGSLAGYDFLDRLEEVEVSTLIVWGRNDMVVPPKDALEFSRRLRSSQTVIFDDTGHVPQAERPVRFNRLLERLLSS
jgi:pimeloyl-ACP methyl ester carboxylesterase